MHETLNSIATCVLLVLVAVIGIKVIHLERRMTDSHLEQIETDAKLHRNVQRFWEADTDAPILPRGE